MGLSMEIKKLAFLFTTIVLLSSCVENTYTPESTIKASNYEFGYAYLKGKNINLWSELSDAEPLLQINASEPLKVMVMGNYAEKLVIHVQAEKEWIRIRYGSDEELKEGFVNYSNVYSDKSLKILYAIEDDADDRIKISPKNYSSSSQLNLAKQNAAEDKYNGNTISEKTCDLYDAALIVSSLDSLKKGEYETKQEFSDKKESLRKLAYSTGAKEKIYAFSEALPTSRFDYDVDTETLSIEILDFETNYSCPSSYSSSTSCSSSEKNFSTISAMTYNAQYSKGFDCPVRKNDGINFMLRQKRSSLGEFKLQFDDGYSKDLVVIEKVKIDRNSARELKETKGLEYKYLIGISVDGNTFVGEEWSRRNCYGGDTYPYEETCYNSDHGRFKFSSDIEYLILFDETGNVVKSYFTSKYINNFLQNDLLIQKHAYENQSILEELDPLDEQEQLAKLFFNRIKK